jgi:cyclopropane fatty-acyl-phospholipid synthase-like methyltransferase
MGFGQVIRRIKFQLKALVQTTSERRHGLVGPARLWKMKRDFQIGFLKGVGLKADSVLLDLGCGTLRGGIPIIEYLATGNYYGIESRDYVLSEGRKELQEAGLEQKRPVLLATDDLEAVCLEQQFDFIWAFSVLIHMDDENLDHALKLVSKHLKEGGRFFANVNIGDRQEGRWQGFPVVWRTYDFYTAACSKHDLDIFDLGPLSDLGHVGSTEANSSMRMLRITKSRPD